MPQHRHSVTANEALDVREVERGFFRVPGVAIRLWVFVLPSAEQATKKVRACFRGWFLRLVLFCQDPPPVDLF